MKNHLLRVSLLCTSLLMLQLIGRANELLPVSLTERINKAAVIAEGEVISQTCFRNSEKGSIYTSNIIKVYKILKGTLSTEEIEVITYGGRIGDLMQVYSSFLKLSIGETGIFFCTPSTVNNQGNLNRRTNSFEVYSSMQGFIAYDAHLQSAADPFTKYKTISDAIYAVRSITHTERIISANPILKPRKAASQLRETAAPTISNFSPTTIPAGIGAVLTITGSGFGPATDTSIGACVQFKNADNGGSGWIRPMTIEYVSWTDTEIKVKVPSFGTTGSSAGTGFIRVINSDPDTVVSSSVLTIPYSYMNVPDETPIMYQPKHFAQNPAMGGYTFRMSKGFAANTAASAAFTRAMTTWLCRTGMNWKIGENTDVNAVAYDGVNVVRIENPGELPAGVLGVCSSWYVACGSPLTALVGELDVVFDDNLSGLFTWQYGPATPNSSQVDFETVALHELGHGQQLSHVISPGAVMHFSIGKGQTTRTLSPDDITGGNVVTANDFAGSCAPTMTPGELFVRDADTSTICSQGAYNYTLVSGTGVTGTWSRPTVAGISNIAGSGSGDIQESLINTTSSPILVKYIYSLTNGAGCTGTDTAYITVNPIGTAIAGTSGGARVCTSQTVAGAGTVFSDTACKVIGKVVPSGASPVAGIINVCTEYESGVPSVNSQPYCERHFDIEPASGAATATATITLYYTQAEFNAYNAANGAYPDLPVNAGDAAGIANLRITQFHGTSASGLPASYSGSTELIDPVDASIIFNASASRWEITFDVTGFSGFFVHTGALALPLRLLQFSGRKNGNSNVLSWTTTAEKDISSFDIQRSFNGSSFTTIGSVTATGNGTGEKTYSYTDDVSNLSQPTYYYRLQISELNGQPSLSKIVSVQDDISRFAVKVLQNPFAQQLQLDVSSPLLQDGVITLTDMNGRRLSQRKLAIQAGHSIIDIPGVQPLLKGTYVVTLVTATEKVVSKVMKQ